MKYILVAVSLFILSSCGCNTYKEEVSVTYYNGQSETIIVNTDILFLSTDGCLDTSNEVLRCGVRSFHVITKQLIK